MATFIFTVVGDDRPGLVSALSAPINAHGASWERSQMSRLAGKFAGIVLVTVADERFDALVADLTALSAQGLQVALERTDEPVERESQRLHLELLGADHPGIVTPAARAADRSEPEGVGDAERRVGDDIPRDGDGHPAARCEQR